MPSSKRGITPSKSDAEWGHSNLICGTLKQSHNLCKISTQYVYANRRKVRKTEYFLYSKLRYTYAPQTVHNTNMNMLKDYFIILFYKKRIKETNVKF